jgi:Zn-dependent M28 family amino/carboxypeptidase
MRACLSCLSVFLPIACVLPLSQQPTGDDPVARAEQAISIPRYRARLRFLADDILEGRGPGARGGDLAARYLASEFETLELQGGGKDGGFLKPVPLNGMRSEPPEYSEAVKGGEKITFEHHKEIVVGAMSTLPVSEVDGEIVYVGFGIRAPEQQDWDDYKGMDVRGKVLLCLVNDPPSEDPKVFGGPAMTYYGRWTYKFEEAERRGALACLLIHTDGSAGYPWTVVQSSWSGREQFALARGPEEPAAMTGQGWIAKPAAARLLAAAGHDVDALRETAKTKEFKPVSLGFRFRTKFSTRVRPIESPNVVAVLRGSDPKLAEEAVVYTSHYDHLGMGREVEGDRIYNGAYDNASGAATLAELAAAFKALPQPPKRSIVFVNTTAEESGLLGAAYYARAPTIDLARTVAVINLDGVNIRGKTKDMRALGIERSTLKEVVEGLGARCGIKIVGDQFPQRGYFYRSDHFPFARRGVPPVSLGSGLDYVGRPEGWGKEQEDLYTATKYHQPSDEYSPSWDLSGAEQTMRFAFRLGVELADATSVPEWNPGDEFEAARKASRVR